MKKTLILIGLLFTTALVFSQPEYPVWTDDMVIQSFSDTANLTITGGDLKITKFNKGSGMVYLVYNKDTGVVDTIPITVPVDGLWETNILGVKPIGDVPVYLTDIDLTGGVDTFSLGLVKSSAVDTLIGNLFLGGVRSSYSSGTYSGNHIDTLSLDDGLLFSLDSINGGFQFSVDIHFADNLSIVDSIDIFLFGVETNGYTIDSSNQINVVISPSFQDTFFYMDILYGDVGTPINDGGDIVLRTNFEAINPTIPAFEIKRDTVITVSFLAVDTNYIKIDAIQAVAYYTLPESSNPLVIDAATGRVIQGDPIEYVDVDVLLQTGGTVVFRNTDNDLVYLIGHSATGASNFNITASGETNALMRINAENDDWNQPASVQSCATSNVQPVNEMTIKYIDGVDTIERDFKMDLNGFHFGDSETGSSHYTMPPEKGNSGQYLAMKSDFENGGVNQMFWHGGDAFSERYYTYEHIADITSFNTTTAIEIQSDTLVLISTDSLLRIDAAGVGVVGSVLTQVSVSGDAEWVTSINSIQGEIGSSATTIDWALGSHYDFEFGGVNEVFTFTDPPFAGIYTLSLLQDMTGTRLATFPATVKWVGGTAPTLTTTANTGYDLITFRFDGSNYYELSRSLDIR